MQWVFMREVRGTFASGEEGVSLGADNTGMLILHDVSVHPSPVQSP